MGKDPGEIAGEIKDLREESNLLLDELLRRTNPSYVAGGITHTLRAKAGEAVDRGSASVSLAATRLPDPVQRNPYPFVAGIIALGAMVGFLIARIRRPKPRTLPEKAAERLRQSREAAIGGIDFSREQVQEAVERLRGEMWARGIGTPPRAQIREDDSMLKRVLWAAMASAMAALGSIVFKKATETVWRSTMREEPPK